MTTLIAFIAERMAVSAPDILIGGLGGYLLARRQAWGLGVLALYGMAVVGTLMGPAPDYFGPIFGVFSAGGMAWFSINRRRKRGVVPPTE